MIPEIKYMLYLAGCGARNQIAVPPDCEIDWKLLFEEAAKSKLDSFVFYTVKKTGNLGYPSDLIEKAVSDVIHQSIKYHYGCKHISDLQKELEQEGIRSAVLKGYAVSRAYAVPELRMGCDVDLYIDRKNEVAAFSWFRAHDWRMVQERDKSSHHSEWVKDSFGMVELHVCFHGKNFNGRDKKETYSRGIWEPSKPFLSLEVPNGCIKTLDYGEHAVFLCSHMARHLLGNIGAVLRQLLDIAVFFERYSSFIDIKQFWESLKMLGYDKLISIVLRTAEQYMGFTFGFEIPTAVTSEQMTILLDEYCKRSDIEYEERNRVVHEYSLSRAVGRKSRYAYKARVLQSYFILFKKRIKEWGLCKSIKFGVIRFNEVMLGKYQKTACAAKCEATGAEKKLKFLKKMGMMEHE